MQLGSPRKGKTEPTENPTLEADADLVDELAWGPPGRPLPFRQQKLHIEGEERLHPCHKDSVEPQRR